MAMFEIMPYKSDVLVLIACVNKICWCCTVNNVVQHALQISVIPNFRILIILPTAVANIAGISVFMEQLQSNCSCSASGKLHIILQEIRAEKSALPAVDEDVFTYGFAWINDGDEERSNLLELTRSDSFTSFVAAKLAIDNNWSNPMSFNLMATHFGITHELQYQCLTTKYSQRMVTTSTAADIRRKQNRNVATRMTNSAMNTTNDEKALQLYDDAIAIDAQYLPALIGRMSLLFKLHRMKEVIIDARAILALDPENRAAKAFVSNNSSIAQPDERTISSSASQGHVNGDRSSTNLQERYGALIHKLSAETVASNLENDSSSSDHDPAVDSETDSNSRSRHRSSHKKHKRKRERDDRKEHKHSRQSAKGTRKKIK